MRNLTAWPWRCPEGNCLINDCCGRTQPTVGSAMPGQGGPVAEEKKKTNQAMGSETVSSFLHGLCFGSCPEFPQ